MGKRRGNHEGSIFQRSDGSWAAEISYRDPSGQIKRPRRIAKTQKEARERLKELQRLVDQGVKVSRPVQTVEEFSREWLASVEPSVKVRTFEGYESIFRIRINPKIGRLKLSQVTQSNVQSLYAALRDEGLSPRSILHTHAVLSKCFRQALDWGHIGRNPVASVRRPRAERSEMKVWTRGQVTEFLDSTREHRWYGLFCLAITTGMRHGELLGLRWKDIDLDAKRLSVVQSLQRQRKAGLTFVSPKTRQSRRTIMLSERAVKALRAHRKRQNAIRLKSGAAWEDNDLVFAGQNGRPSEPSTVTEAFKRATDAAGLPTIRFHDLRHTAATLLLSQGKHPKVVSDMLGHSSIAITLDTYSHLVPALHEEAAAAMDEMLGA